MKQRTEDLIRAVVEWAERVGERVAQAQLIMEGVAPNTAQKLTCGRYPHKPSHLMVDAIKRAMSKERDVAS